MLVQEVKHPVSVHVLITRVHRRQVVDVRCHLRRVVGKRQQLLHACVHHALVGVALVAHEIQHAPLHARQLSTPSLLIVRRDVATSPRGSERGQAKASPRSDGAHEWIAEHHGDTALVEAVLDREHGADALPVVASAVVAAALQAGQDPLC